MPPGKLTQRANGDRVSIYSHVMAISLCLIGMVAGSLIYSGSLGFFVTQADALQRLEIVEFQNRMYGEALLVHQELYQECKNYTLSAKQASVIIHDFMQVFGKSQAVTSRTFELQSKHNEKVDLAIEFVGNMTSVRDNTVEILNKRIKRLEVIIEEMSKPQRPNNQKPIPLRQQQQQQQK